MNKIKKILFILGIISVSLKVYAFTPFVIRNIQVNGLQRIEIGTVFSYLPVKVGDNITGSQADDIIQKLYGTGFFKDVRLEKTNNTLIIDVMERPVIADLSITGDHEFDHDKLIKALNDNGLVSGRVFNQAVLDETILGLKSEYYNRGLYSVIINPQVIPLKRNRVAVNIAISEGLTAKIANIAFVGNDTFSSSQLKKQMFLSTGDLFSWWYKDNQYSNDKLSADIDNIKAFYMNQGYINFHIYSIQVQLSPDKKSVYITINISEGSQYRLSDIKLGGDTKTAPMDELEKLITLKKGNIINQKDLNSDIENIKTKLGEYGYAYALVNAIPKVDDVNKTVSYVLFIDTGNKIYIRNINISGNNKTRDIVVRREFRQQEFALYNAKKIKRSRERINLLGYFDSVEVSTNPVVGNTNQADVEVKVKEKSTSNVFGSIGYVQGQGLLVSGGLSQANLFGSGKSLSLNFSTGLISQGASISFTDPYFMANGTTLGYDLYYNKYMPYNMFNGSPYLTQTIGFKSRSSMPVSEYDRINFSLGLERVEVSSIGNNIPLRFINFNQQYGTTVYDLPFSVGWVRNSTDSALWPTTGGIFSQTADATLPFIGPQYYRLTSNNSWFIPISNNITWKTTGTFGVINSYGSGEVPFYQNYYMGGINSLPGYYMNSLGPKDTDSTAFGGTRSATLTNDLLFPLPGFKDNHLVRMGLFFDMGTLWGGDRFAVTASQAFRASYGVSMTWFSPIVPLKFAYSFPLYNQPNDLLEPFQFMLGASF